MKNNLNFTKEMKTMISDWKGQFLKSYTENSDDGYFSIVRFLIGDKLFDVNNEYVLYEYPDKDCTELTCFSCVETDKSKPLQSHIVDGTCKEYIVDEKIVDIYIVTDTEKGCLFDSGIPYKLNFETAVIIQTERHCYALWRNLSVYTIEIAVGEDIDGVLKTIKSVKEIQEEAQGESPYAVTVERTIEKL